MKIIQDFKTGRWCSIPALIFLRFYQIIFSPLKIVLGLNPTVCRFYPTCSHYSMKAIKRHGLWNGVILTLKRILSCHPWHPGGYDPIPDKMSWKSVFALKNKKTH